MLVALGSAALRTVVLAILVQLSLKALRIRRPQILNAAWSVVLVASLAMPALERSIPIDLPILAEQEPSVADVEFQKKLRCDKLHRKPRPLPHSRGNCLAALA
jgi:hypothetical protein